MPSGREPETWLHEQLGKRHHLVIVIVAAAALAFTASFGVAWAAGFGRVGHALVHPHWIWLPVAFAGEALAYVGYTFAYRDVVRAERGAELEVPKTAALVATGFGVFVQAGGFALDRAALERAGLSEGEARARVLGLGMLEYLVLAPATAVAALIVLLRRDGISQGLTLPWLIGVPLGIACALIALHFKDRFRRRSGGWRRHAHDTLQALGLALSIVRRPQKYALAPIGIAVYWFGDIFCLWAALHVFYAHTPPIAQLVVGYATGYALTRRSLPLGGAGVVEALLPFALGWVDIKLAQALLAVVAYRLINLWLPMIPALAGMPALRSIERRRPRQARAHSR
jgi:uncharacterized membrane protein YbhN (UPF0104 family)